MKTIFADDLLKQRDNLRIVLIRVLNEVSPGLKPFDSDSHLPQHLTDAIRDALEKSQ